jgi:dienelactone hydrolase
MHMRRLLLPLTLLLAAGAAHAEVQTREISYQVDGEDFQGYLALDDEQSGERPGVLVLHEWWGHTDYVRRRARMLADAGYTAFAADLYGQGKVAEHPDDAKSFMKAATSDPARLQRRFDKAHDLLRAHPSVDPERTAAIGYCMGGGIALEMARAGKDLEAVVSFHGTLDTDNRAQKGDIEPAILVLTGGADPFVPEKRVTAFREEMQAAGAQFRVHVYPDARHGFTNPAADDYAERFDLPLAYDSHADRDSWNRMKRLFERHLE